MGESLTKSRDTSLELDEDLRKEGLLVIKIGDNSPPVAWLGGEVVVDSRKQIGSQHPRGWINRTEWDKHGELINAVRTAGCSSNFDRKMMNEFLLRAGRKIGLRATSAVIVGDVPKHWKEKNHITRHFFRSREELERLYPPLDTP